MRALLLGPHFFSDQWQDRLLPGLKINPAKDLLVGVDGGLKTWLQLGYRPNFGVGDWDSLSNKKILSRIPHITLSRNKDRSDLFYAVLAAVEAGAQELVCLGVTGGRPDHHLAMIYDLSRFSLGSYGKLKSVQARGTEGIYHFISEKIPNWEGEAPIGSIVSLLPIGNQAEGVTLTGLRYPLKNGILTPSSHGISNRTIRRKFQVFLRKGQLLVIILQ